METIQALDFIQSNYSFASAADDSEKFWIMFPDSEIAKSYNQGETKWKYVIQFGTSNNWYWMILKGSLSLCYLMRLPPSKSRSNLIFTYNTCHLKIKLQIFMLVLASLGIATVTSYFIIFIILSKSWSCALRQFVGWHLNFFLYE